MLTLALTRYFVDDEENEIAYTATFSLKDSVDPAKLVDNFKTRKIEHELRDMGTWREMTDDEATDYMSRQEED